MYAARVLTLLQAAQAAVAEASQPVFSTEALGFELVLVAPTSPPSDATNYLGGVADVLEAKATAAHSSTSETTPPSRCTRTIGRSEQLLEVGFNGVPALLFRERSLELLREHAIFDLDPAGIRIARIVEDRSGVTLEPTGMTPELFADARRRLPLNRWDAAQLKALEGRATAFDPLRQTLINANSKVEQETIQRQLFNIFTALS